MQKQLLDQLNFTIGSGIGNICYTRSCIYNNSCIISWGVLFSHPADYTPVCTTELGTVATLVPEFTKRGCKVIALSCDSVEDHKGWIKDIQV